MVSGLFVVKCWWYRFNFVILFNEVIVWLSIIMVLVFGIFNIWLVLFSWCFLYVVFRILVNYVLVLMLSVSICFGVVFDEWMWMWRSFFLLWDVGVVGWVDWGILVNMVFVLYFVLRMGFFLGGVGVFKMVLGWGVFLGVRFLFFFLLLVFCLNCGVICWFFLNLFCEVCDKVKML